MMNKDDYSRTGFMKLVSCGCLLVATWSILAIAASPPLSSKPPPGGDVNARHWLELNERWIRNYYEDGAITMSDRNTGLLWLYDGEAGGRRTWPEAVAFCEQLDYAGYKDWELPGKNQLRPIYSQQHLFSNVQNDWYWTTTPQPTVVSFYFVVGMGDEGGSRRYGGYNFFRLPGVIGEDGYIYSYRFGNFNWVWPCRRNDPGME